MLQSEKKGRLKEERGRLGLTQEAFGGLGGVSRAAQESYESGRRDVSSDYLASLAKAGVDVMYILTGVRTGTNSGKQAQDFQDYPEIGTALVLDVMLFVDTWLTENNLTMPPSKKVEMVKVLCRFLVKQDRERGQMSGSAENIIHLREYTDFLKAACV